MKSLMKLLMTKNKVKHLSGSFRTENKMTVKRKRRRHLGKKVIVSNEGESLVQANLKGLNVFS